MNLIQEYIEFFSIRYENIMRYLVEHLTIAAVSIVAAIVLTVPLAIWMTKMKNERLKQAIFNLANFFQTIPTIALFAILIPFFGIGFVPAVVALFLYALLPLLRNTYAGVESIDQGIVEAAKGMGYSTFGRLMKVELPIAVPYIMSGIRITTVYIISWTTLASVIGAGGLGDLVMAGIGSNNTYMIFTGTVMAIGLALIVDTLFGLVEKRLSHTRAS
ncbi:osmoprotectant transport system permease protein [Streptohalobacillus salinus]|uniref:Osmoprotectant transport system permease protein n=1 Tax=Streptohalobacillus salinus TaxID=621096 RepID=A0A2V3WVA6_9BACI|nr:ABC transporter permease [Streptohalobacillus salinus]PXW93032.1 osmoprotectant transport system permease protein [Streptohalobacillus salinus]